MLTLPHVFSNNSELTNYLKWDTMCELSRIGLPVLDACFISPNTSPSEAEIFINRFCSNHNISNILIRTDSRGEIADPPTASISADKDSIIAFAKAMIAINRAVIVSLPASRFTNLMTYNVNISKDGSFFIEILGPGYENGDLRRNKLTPQCIIRSKPHRVENIIFYDRSNKLSFFDIAIEYDNSEKSQQERVRQRLETIAKKILPTMYVTLPHIDQPEVEARQWLIANGYTALGRALQLRFEDIQQWCADAARWALHSMEKRNSNQIEECVLSGTVITDSAGKPQTVYWDSYTANRWHIPAHISLHGNDFREESQLPISTAQC